MSRIAIPATKDNAPTASQPLLDGVEKQLGSVPNVFRLLANSPAVLQGFVGFSGALGRTLDARTRERIALAVAAVDGCEYCLAAHTFIGAKLARLDADELALNRGGTSRDPKAAAAVAFAKRVVETRGRVSDEDLAAVRTAGFGDAQIVEIVAVVAENFFTNIINNVAHTEVDFPAVETTA